MGETMTTGPKVGWWYQVFCPPCCCLNNFEASAGLLFGSASVPATGAAYFDWTDLMPSPAGTASNLTGLSVLRWFSPSFFARSPSVPPISSSVTCLPPIFTVSAVTPMRSAPTHASRPSATSARMSFSK